MLLKPDQSSVKHPKSSKIIWPFSNEVRQILDCLIWGILIPQTQVKFTEFQCVDVVCWVQDQEFLIAKCGFHVMSFFGIDFCKFDPSLFIEGLNGQILVDPFHVLINFALSLDKKVFTLKEVRDFLTVSLSVLSSRIKSSKGEESTSLLLV